ncbi:MAG: nuclear transport factor 2 family protein [Thermoleophilaceae bacterium]
MPQRSEELLQSLLEAANRRDAAALAAICTPDVEFRPVVAALTGEAYRGEEGIRRWLAEIERRFPGSYAAADEVESSSHAAIASGRTRGRDMSFAWHVVVRVDGGLIASWSFHPSREHAERAAAQ